MERARWDGPPAACVRCGVTGRCSLLTRTSGERRVWRCAACRAQFSVLAGTIFERTRVPLPVWLDVFGDVAETSEVSARGIARRRGLAPATARLMRNRLIAAGVRAGDRPDEALRRVLRLASAEVAQARRTVPGRRDLAEGPSAEF